MNQLSSAKTTRVVSVGFIQVIRSIEDLLFEIMTWLVFYPRTLWQIIRHPITLVRYSEEEQDDADDERYSDTLSPPIFLMLSVLLAHVLELSTGQSLAAQTGLLSGMAAGSEEALLLLRSVLFAVYPVLFSAALLKQQQVPLDRKVLREPFFSQCYLASFYALLTSVAAILAKYSNQYTEVAAGLLALGAAIWFISVEARWFRLELGVSHGRAIWIAVATFFKASFLNGLLATAIAI
jgi:hypothetical protein